MHDCRKIGERLTELLFNELSNEEGASMLAEIFACEDCRAEYQTLQRALSTVDEASDLLMPDESYWSGYEARLQMKLAASAAMPVATNQEAQTLRQRLQKMLASFKMQSAWAVSFAALLLLAFVIWVWLKQPNPNYQAPQKAEEKPTVVQPSNKKKEQENVADSSTPDENEKKDFRRGPDFRYKNKSFRPSQDALRMTAGVDKQRQKTVQQLEPSMTATSAEVNPTIASVTDEETLRHFEKAQMLLRSFRNLNAAEDDAKIEISDEKQRSRSLVLKNVWLRREAEAKGNLPVEEVLGKLEPLLIDIANLPDNAAQEDIRAIRERVQKRQMIAALQLYSARPVIARADTN
jgi:hypothetical protein